MTHTETHVKSGPKDLFMYLLAIAALYTSTVNFITLIFGYIDLYFPDALNPYYTYQLGSLRWAIASLIILFPVYLIASWLINRDIAKNPAKKEIRIRKWLIYLTLFIAALVMIGDLVTLIYYFLEGNTTIRFILKVLTVFAAAGAIFGYYFFELKGSSRAIRKISAIASGIVIVVVIIAGFMIAGSPFEQRLKKADETRISHLQTIQGQIIYTYWPNKNRLPATLSDLNDDISGFRAPTDPETDSPYTYNVKSALTFELCAQFNTASAATVNGGPKAVPAPYYTGPYGETYDNWEHSSGLACFERTIDPEIYRQNPKPQPL